MPYIKRFVINVAEFLDLCILYAGLFQTYNIHLISSSKNISFNREIKLIILACDQCLI